MTVDFQINTIYRDLRSALPGWRGKVLDIGCGQSPYRFLLDPTRSTYQGIDISDAKHFDYSNPHILPFDGEEIPFPDATFDAFLCTEVLEHVIGYQQLVDEMYRVTKPGGTGIITVPWSARYHYIPFDYFRYTPSALKRIFGRFREVDVRPRGTDVVAIVSKLVVLTSRNLMPNRSWKWVLVPLWIAALPLLGFAVLVAHVALTFNVGSKDDPLGYTVVLKK